MKKNCLSWVVAVLLGWGGLQLAAETSPHRLELGGRPWLPWPEARQQAMRESRPILLVQMFGELDETWC